MISPIVQKIDPKMVWDLGANDGRLTRPAVKRGGIAIAFDSDPAAVEKNYLQVKRKRDRINFRQHGALFGY